jgi:hypothetical protein
MSRGEAGEWEGRRRGGMGSDMEMGREMGMGKR